MVSVSAWEAIFMLVVLKLPMVYLAAVVWWAIRAEPRPAIGGEGRGTVVPLTPCGWDDQRRTRRAPRGRPFAPRRPAPRAPGRRSGARA